MQQHDALAESESTRASAAASGLEETRKRAARMESAHALLQKELRESVQKSAVGAAKLESMEALHAKEVDRLKAELHNAKTLAARAADELKSGNHDCARLRAAIKDRTSLFR